MKHAGPQALESLAALLAPVRALAHVKEKSPGVFYIKGRAWLHFHEDQLGLFADIRPGAEWIRICLSSAEGQAQFLALLASAGPG